MPVDRYHRQILLPSIGPEGQKRLSASRVLLVGCGALGSTVADQLVRAGVGYLRLVDRDIVELTNLQRQTLYDEHDVSEGLPKAVAAAKRLAAVNSSVTIEPAVTDLYAGNVEDLMQSIDLVVDGTDNVQTRYLVNDAAVKAGKPWIYGGAVGTEGRVMTIRPRKTPCLRCVFPETPLAHELPTCDTAGILGPVAGVIASMESLAAIKILTGNECALANELLVMDLWNNRLRSIDLTDARRPDCPCCGQNRFEFLDAVEDATTSLCGRNAVQVRPAARVTIDLPSIAKRWHTLGKVNLTPFFVKCELREPENRTLTLFSDGRLIVQGTSDPGQAKSLYARFVGS